MTAVVNPSFLPWLRTGIATSLDAPAVDGLAPGDSASISIGVTIYATGTTDTRLPVDAPAIRLRAPGEVIGIDQALVVRRDPEAGTTDAESNFFALVEFSAPDLPWRYTPASAAGGKLQPWLALVVVEEREGVSLETGGRLAILHVDDAAKELPDLSQCWAWAHVQADTDLTEGVAGALDGSPEAFRSRLLCPRHLAPNRAWIACVVPTFKSGAAAGLGQPVIAGMGLAWAQAGGGVDLPVYHWWRFQTGRGGDFESLVRRLVPRSLPGTIGRRDLDLSEPGGGVTGSPGTFVSYEGALLSAAGGSRPWPLLGQLAMRGDLRDLLNAELTQGDDDEDYDALSDDPVVGPPAYAINQAGAASIPQVGASPVWLEELNTVPANRAVAGIGGAVIRRDQESLMARAWEFAADARAAVPVLGRARTAWEVAGPARAAFDTLTDAAFLQVAGPAMARLAVAPGLTAAGRAAASPLPDGLLSGAFRRVTRNAPGFVSVGSAASTSTAELVTDRVILDAVGFVATWADALPPAGAGVERTLGLPTGGRGGRVGGLGGARPDASTARARSGTAGSAGSPDAPGPGRETGRTSAARTVDVDGTRDYVLADPLPEDWAAIEFDGDDDSVGRLVTQTKAALDPRSTIRAMVDARVGGLAADRPTDVPDRVFVHPVFRTAMYRGLVDLSVEYLVPGIGGIPDHTVGLLLTNPPFIEAYLAGLNHELGQEFVWREYPARPDGTWFTHFWEGGAGGSRDIQPIKLWDEALGSNAPEGPPNATSEPPTAELVLLLRTPLLRRYPDLRVYAVPAKWDGDVRIEDTDAAPALPLFAARLGSDTAAFGFDLGLEEARGTTDGHAKPGWFFVLEQVPEGPRFGLDIGKKRRKPDFVLKDWTDLRWSDAATPDDTRPDFVDVAGPAELVAAGALPGNGATDADTDRWGSNAAAMARITYQRPVRMLVHADAMLPEPVA